MGLFKTTLTKLKINFREFKLNLKKTFSEKKQKRFYKHDEKLVQQLSGNKKIPNLKQMNFIYKYLSKSEKFIIRILSGIILIALASLVINVYWDNSIIIPKNGGSYTEGLVGYPSHINPLYSLNNEVDATIATLVYSSLIKYDGQNMVTDLAESYEISQDQKIYTFKLRQNVKWHDGEDFNAEDVIFTFDRIQNKTSNSALYFNFKGVEIKQIDDYTVQFTLAEPFAPFLESLTVGILPEHIWKNTQPENFMLAEYNLKPIGTGPYKFESLTKNKDGQIKAYQLEKNDDYYIHPPYINEISFKFFDSFEQVVAALNNKNVEGINYLPKEIRERIINNRNLNFNLLQLPQYSALFFNYTDSPILKDLTLRKILSHSINKEKIVNEILNAEAQIIDSPILPNSIGYTDDITKYPFNLAHAKEELEKADWDLADYEVKTTESTNEDEETQAEVYPFQVRQKNNRYLEFTLTTVDQPETTKIAKELQKEWQQIGAKVNLIIVDNVGIQDIIKNRDYEILLYGQILGYDPDPFPFWHSAQRTYPGLNLTSYQDPKIDTLLEEARKINDKNERAEKYIEFQKLIAESVPAIFLYNPTYTYPQNKKIKGFDTKNIIIPSNRFNNVANWYIKTSRKWSK